MTVIVAAVQPACVAQDVAANARLHADAIRAAGARLVVFPELSLTGYELDAEVVSLDDLDELVTACAETDSIALVGAPVAGDHIATLRVQATGVDLVYRKTFLGGDELARFTAGDGPVALDVDGWRVGLGICKDTGVAQHIADTAALGVDLYVAGLVHLPSELEEQEARAVRIARACDSFVAFASFAGATGGGYDESAGHSALYAADGTPLAHVGAEIGAIARATLSDAQRPGEETR